jgi:hypothetical protein
MPTVRGCAFPDHLRYDVPNHLWYEALGDGTARIGMTVGRGGAGRRGAGAEIRIDPKEKSRILPSVRRA